MIDPVLRCQTCQMLVKHETLKKLGKCTKCGNKRFGNIQIMDEKELEQIKEWGFTELAEQFEGINDAD